MGVCEKTLGNCELLGPSSHCTPVSRHLTLGYFSLPQTERWLPWKPQVYASVI